MYSYILSCELFLADVSKIFEGNNCIVTRARGGKKFRRDWPSFWKKNNLFKKKRGGGVRKLESFFFMQIVFNGAPRIFKFFRYFAKKKQEQNFQLKIPPAPVLLQQDTNPFLMFDLLTLLFAKTGFILFFYSESVRQTVLKMNIFIIIKLLLIWLLPCLFMWPPHRMPGPLGCSPWMLFTALCVCD